MSIPFYERKGNIMLIAIVVLVAVFLVFVLYACYVGVVKARNQMDEALSGIDVQLKKRSDLIPNVLQIAQKFMTHEKEIFTEITELRTEVMKQPVGTVERFVAESKLQAAMKQFVVSVENYPQLKSDETMLKAMDTYKDVEDNIAASRRFYNTALRELKNKTQIFPGSLFAKCAGDISEYAYFQASDEDKNNINADDYLK